jgi:hypothetical protein
VAVVVLVGMDYKAVVLVLLVVPVVVVKVAEQTMPLLEL